MGVVALIFLLLVLYWTVKQIVHARHEAIEHEATAAEMLLAVPEPTATRRPADAEAAVPRPTISTQPAGPIAQPSSRTSAEPVAAMTPPLPTTSAVPTTPLHMSGVPTTLTPADHEAIRGLPMFADVSDEDREHLISVMRFRFYKAGEKVFEEHESASGVCLLVRGRIGLLTEIGHGKHITVGTVRPDELFAWSGVCDDHRFTATAHAVEDSFVAVLPEDAVHELCESSPHLGYHLMEAVADTIAERIHDRDTQLAGLLS